MALLTTDQRMLARATNGAETVWTGRPLPGFRLRRGDALSCLPLLFIIPFLVFWESKALQIPRADLIGYAFPAFGCVVIAVALWQTCGQVLWAWYARGRTYYALTADFSAVIYTDVFGGMTKRVYLPSVSTINLDVKPDGSGSIVFGDVSGLGMWFGNRYYSPPRPPSFDCIADASHVYDLCTKLQRAKTA